MNGWKKFFRFLSSVFLYSLFVILGIIVLLFLAYAVDQYIGKKNNEQRSPLFGAYVIVSPSMVPNINVYDAVLTMRVPGNKIKLYDIITFISKEIDTHGTPITHRVVGILKTDDGERAYRTKGDNNDSEDRALIRQSEVLGKVLLRIPMIGYVKTFLSSKLGWLVAIVLPCVCIIGSDILKLFGLVKKKDSNTEDNDDKNNNKQIDMSGSEFKDGVLNLSSTDIDDKIVEDEINNRKG